MGLVKGNPPMIVTLFFGAAVVSMGGIYALVPSLLDRPSIGAVSLTVFLGLALGFSLLVVGRTLWVVAKVQRKKTI